MVCKNNKGYGPSIEIADRTPEVHARELSSDVFAFFYYDIVTCVMNIGGEHVELKSERLNVSDMYFVDAVAFTREQLESEPHSSGACKLMDESSKTMAIRNRFGNFETNGFDPERYQIVSAK